MLEHSKWVPLFNISLPHAMHFMAFPPFVTDSPIIRLIKKYYRIVSWPWNYRVKMGIRAGGRTVNQALSLTEDQPRKKRATILSGQWDVLTVTETSEYSGKSAEYEQKLIMWNLLYVNLSRFKGRPHSTLLRIASKDTYLVEVLKSPHFIDSFSLYD